MTEDSFGFSKTPSWRLAAAPPLQQEQELFAAFSISYNDDNEEDVEDDGPANNFIEDDDDSVEEEIKFDNNDDRVLAYLSPDRGASMPRRLRRLVARATRQYHATATSMVGGGNDRWYHRAEDDENGSSSSASLTMDLAEWMESEYKTRQVPLQLKIMIPPSNHSITTSSTTTTTTTDNAAKRTTKIAMPCESDAERLMVEILSLGAIYRLPYEIVQVFLRGIIPLYYERVIGSDDDDDSTEDSRQTIRRLVQDITGWHDIRFPKGLAIKNKRRRRRKVDDAPPTEDARWYQRLFFGRGGGWPNAEQAAALIEAATRQTAPPVVNRTELLLQSIRRQQQQQVADSKLLLPSNSTTTKTTTTMAATNNDNKAITISKTTPPLPLRLGFKLYFPTASRRRQSMDYVRGQWQNLYAKAKAQGRASFLGYCVFNLLFYTVGIWWHHWHRTASVVNVPTTGGGGVAAAAARSILVRRYGKIFGWLYATSQLCKLPKLLFAVGIAPIIRNRVLDHWQRRYGWSDRKSTVVAVMLLLGLFAALTAVPIWHEYRQLLCHISTTTAAAAVGSTMEVVQPV
jgi:hypothetical protein